MADNTALNPGVGGDTIADEDIAGVKYQKIKLIDATVGSTTPIGTAANPLPVSGPLTDAQLRAVAVPVSGTVATGGLTDAQLRATPVPISTTLLQALTDAQLRATPVPVSGTVAVSNALLLDATFTGRINTQGQNTMALSTPVVLPSDQSAIPVTVASLPLSTNAAIETGGNLATIAATNLQIQQLLELQREQLANMKCMCYLLMQIASINLNPNEFMNEAVLQ